MTKPTVETHQVPLKVAVAFSKILSVAQFQEPQNVDVKDWDSQVFYNLYCRSQICVTCGQLLSAAVPLSDSAVEGKFTPLPAEVHVCDLNRFRRGWRWRCRNYTLGLVWEETSVPFEQRRTSKYSHNTAIRWCCTYCGLVSHLPYLKNTCVDLLTHPCPAREWTEVSPNSRDLKPVFSPYEKALFRKYPDLRTGHPEFVDYGLNGKNSPTAV